MSHDTEVAYAYGEIAGDIQSRAASFFGTIGTDVIKLIYILSEALTIGTLSF